MGGSLYALPARLPEYGKSSWGPRRTSKANGTLIRGGGGAKISDNTLRAQYKKE